MSFIEKPFFDFRFAGGGVAAAIIFVIWVNFPHDRVDERGQPDRWP